MSKHSPLLVTYLQQLKKSSVKAPILDLACGGGRNGRYLIEHDIDVVFADIDHQALSIIAEQLPKQNALKEGQGKAQVWQIDFEQEGRQPLNNQSFSAIIVFRYLHRPLMNSIKDAILPGGLIIYETFTTEQPQYGRPTNPNFLLNKNELLEVFESWQVLHHFHGVVDKSDGTGKQAIEQIVARKPLTIV